MSGAAALKPRSATLRVTQTLVERALAIGYDALPADVLRLARQCVLDWIAVTLAAVGDPLVALLVDEALEQGGKPVASLVGRNIKVGALQAALINGTASHALDYDDVNLAISGHPSAVLAPALLALAEAQDARGDELLAAFVAGYEFACRAGQLVAPGHYLRGFHATSTVGSLGAAVACARLLGLDAQRMAHSVGIAATQAAGLKSMFGTQCKPFHAGLAAQNGLRAALLAARGMESRGDALECAQGFAAAMSPDFHPEAALAGPEKFRIRENLFKFHASCYGTHSAIECARRLRAGHGLTPGMIAQVTIRVEHGADAVCNIAEPRTGLEAKFSLRLTTAMALAGRDTSDLTLFTEATASDPELVALRDRTHVELVADWPLMQTEVIVDLDDGRRVRAMCDTGIPPGDYEEQGRRLVAKFRRLVEPVLGAQRCGKLLAMLDDPAPPRVRDLMAECGAPLQ